MKPPLLEVRNLEKRFDVRRYFRRTGSIRALGGVSFSINPGETLAIVGESGCGKTTLARCLLGIEHPSAGEILLDGQPVGAIAPGDFRRQVQMIFQDPYGSLNPRKQAWQIIAEPLAINTALSRDERHTAALEMMRKVGLRPELGERYPHMLSGGQRQRLGIARALVLKPRLLICDEPVSALDVSIQAQILNLMTDLQAELGLAYLFISHDLSVVRHIADRVMVIYLGKIAEHAARGDVFENPRHPYTRALLASTPQVHRTREHARTAFVQGELPSPQRPPPGCAFHRRCPHATDRCASDEPMVRSLGGTLVACHFAESIGAQASA